MDQKFSVMLNSMKIQQPGPAYAAPAAPQQNQQQQQQPSEKRKFKGSCFLCGKPGHGFTDCYTYKNMLPGNVTCQRCGGRHPGQCTTRMNGRPNDQSQGNSNSQSQPPAYSANNSSGQQQFQMGQRLGNGGRQAHPAN